MQTLIKYGFFFSVMSNIKKKKIRFYQEWYRWKCLATIDKENIGTHSRAMDNFFRDVLYKDKKIQFYQEWYRCKGLPMRIIKKIENTHLKVNIQKIRLKFFSATSYIKMKEARFRLM